MTRRCVIERWVQRKTDQKLIFNGNYTKIVFFVFRIHFHYVLSYLFGLFGVRTCVSILWHTSLPKNATLLEKIGKNDDFGDFLWFSCFWHDVAYDVTVASYKVCLYFFWYQCTREGHSYPLVPHTWYFVNRFPRSIPPPGCEMGPKSPALLGLNHVSWYRSNLLRHKEKYNILNTVHFHNTLVMNSFYQTQLFHFKKEIKPMWLVRNGGTFQTIHFVM